MSFHVPELARITNHPIMGTTSADGNNGAFRVQSPEPGWWLYLICSDGNDPDVPEADGWEHVSVHAFRQRYSEVVGLLGRTDAGATRTPTWKEMAYVKRLCWDAEDVVIQYHPRESEYVNCHENVLHMWRSRTQVIPTPPPMLVGPVA